MIRIMRALVASMMTLWAGLAQTGCGAEAAPPVVEAGSAPMDGTGFLPVADGTEVTLIPGAQSGFHVWLSVRVRGMSGPLMIERSARRQRDGVLVFRGLAQRLEVPETALDDWWESPLASPAFMCPSPIGIQVFDEALVFEVRILDMEGALLAEDTLVLIAHCPAGEQEAFCRSICAG
jgi:hypothetical protein